MLLYSVLLMRSQESVHDPLTAATLIQYKGVEKSDSLVASGEKYFDLQPI
jgi:hypothetical protein